VSWRVCKDKWRYSHIYLDIHFTINTNVNVGWLIAFTFKMNADEYFLKVLKGTGSPNRLIELFLIYTDRCEPK
jgi:hypothetical protein